MIKREMLPVSDESFEECDRRVVIWRDTDYNLCTREHQGDHLFTMWGNHRHYDFSDKGAECPFEPVLDEDGEETDEMKVKDGVYAFSVNLYDHSGLSFSLGGDPAHGFDPGGWDTTPGAAWLYVDKAKFEEWMGEGKWMMIPVDTSGTKWTWKKATEDEFRSYLRKRAGYEVDELNLLEQGSMYGWRVERKVKWVKTYPNGNTLDGWDWDEEDSCGGYLTEHANDLDFPREPDLPVFYENDVYLYRSDEEKLGSYEYTVPEFVIVKTDESTGNPMYLFRDSCKYGNDLVAGWTAELDKARIIHSWYLAQSVAQDYIAKESYDAYRNIIEKDKLK